VFFFFNLKSHTIIIIIIIIILLFSSFPELNSFVRNPIYFCFFALESLYHSLQFPHAQRATIFLFRDYRSFFCSTICWNIYFLVIIGQCWKFHLHENAVIRVWKHTIFFLGFDFAYHFGGFFFAGYFLNRVSTQLPKGKRKKRKKKKKEEGKKH